MMYIPEGFAHGFLTLEDNTSKIQLDNLLNYFIDKSKNGMYDNFTWYNGIGRNHFLYFGNAFSSELFVCVQRDAGRTTEFCSPREWMLGPTVPGVANSH